MKTCLLIGIGGAAGAILRYLLGMLPLSGDFPLATFLTNLLGAIAIGLVIGVSERFPQLPRELVLFLKTGFCGGFTTFSTFSLETLTLLEGGQAVLGEPLCRPKRPFLRVRRVPRPAVGGFPLPGHLTQTRKGAHRVAVRAFLIITITQRLLRRSFRSACEYPGKRPQRQARREGLQRQAAGRPQRHWPRRKGRWQAGQSSW